MEGTGGREGVCASWFNCYVLIASLQVSLLDQKTSLNVNIFLKQFRR